MADGELQDMEHFFTLLPSAFSDSEAFKTSVVGMNIFVCAIAVSTLDMGGGDTSPCI